MSPDRSQEQASAPRTVAGAFADGLVRAGVRRIFGMPGGSTSLDLIGKARERGVEFVLAHTEAGACYMASTYGLLTGTTGVAVVTRGPGFTSAVNGLAQATLDRSPLLLVSDSVPAADRGRISHQRIDHRAVASPLTKWSGTIGHEGTGETVDAALDLARAAPAGAVHLDFDPTAAGDVVPLPGAPVDREQPPLGHAVDIARATFREAARPLVIIGPDVADHHVGLREVLVDLDCPILTTYQAKGAVPESWRSSAGLFTGAALDDALITQADLVVGIGLDPIEAIPGAWSSSSPVVLLHRHSVDPTYFHGALVVADTYEDVLLPLLEALDPRDWPPDAAARHRAGGVQGLRPTPASLSPLEVVRVTQACRPNALATVDGGAHMLVVMPLWMTDEPRAVLISNGLATMGYALPAAIGCALARPDRRVVCFVGDGGLAMVQAELETLARLGLDVTVVVFNDAQLSLISLKDMSGEVGREGVEFGPVDYAAVATAMGVPGRVVSDAQELREALITIPHGPLLVDARIDTMDYRAVLRTVRG